MLLVLLARTATALFPARRWGFSFFALVCRPGRRRRRSPFHFAQTGKPRNGVSSGRSPCQL